MHFNGYNNILSSNVLAQEIRPLWHVNVSKEWKELSLMLTLPLNGSDVCQAFSKPVFCIQEENFEYEWRIRDVIL